MSRLRVLVPLVVVLVALVALVVPYHTPFNGGLVLRPVCLGVEVYGPNNPYLTLTPIPVTIPIVFFDPSNRTCG